MIRVVVAMALAAAAANAQQTVSGSVLDPAGAAVPKAEVSLMSAGEGAADSARMRATTSDDGFFRFANVKPGQYVLEVKAGKFQTATQAVPVASAPVSVRVLLAISAAGESVSVSAKSSKVTEQGIDSERNADRLNFDDNMLDALPAPGGNALGVVTNFLSPASQGAEGVTVMVDGVETSASALPASSIRRIRVNRNPYSAQFRRPGKARVDVYSEEGSIRRMRAAFGMTARNSVFDSKNAFAPVKPAMDRTMLDGNFSMPVVKNRSSIYLNAEHYRNRETAVVNARILDGAVVQNVATPERRTRVLGRYEVRGEGHQTSLQYGWLDESEQNRGVGGLKLLEQGVPSSTISHRVQFSDRALLMGKLLNDFRVVGQWETAERGVPAVGPAIQVHGAFSGGPSQTYWSRRETTLRVQNSASIVLAKHTLRFGAEARPGFYRSMEGSQFGGTYEFASLDAFAAGRSLLYRVNRGNPDVSLSQHEAFGFVQDEFSPARGWNLNLGVRYGWQSDVGDFNNVAPRAGFAYSPGKSGRTVIRGGAGIFYERVNDEIRRRSLLWDGARLQEFVFPDVAYPFAGASGGGLARPNLIRTSGLLAPQLAQGSIGIEQQIHARTTVAVEYQRLSGRYLLRSRNVNAPMGGIRPSDAYLAVQQIESTASMSSDSLAATLRGSAGKYLTAMVQYTLSRSCDDSPGPFSYPANSYEARREWGRSDFDQRHRFNSAAMLELAKGYRIGTFLSVGSGRPYNVTTGRDDNGDTIVNDRPAGIARNTGAGPGFVQFDLRFTKLLRLPRLLERGRSSSSRNVELSVDVFNLLNRVNYAGFTGVITSPFFGLPNAALTPRTTQFSLRYRM